MIDETSPAPHVRLYDDDLSPAEAEVVLVPVLFDGTCTYGLGASDGPAAIADASHQVDWYDLETGRGERPRVSMLAIPQGIRERSDATRALAERVRSFRRIPERAPPAELEAELRPYQHRGFRWMCAQIGRAHV